jgi:REP element-mobilizing transposase RayT
MSPSYVSALYHCVWSTKYRRMTIKPELRDRLWPYLGGIARKHKIKALAIGGVEDHVHMLLSIPATIEIAKAIQLIKGGASKWVHDSFPEFQEFGWQEGYGAFSIGISQTDDTIVYIDKQAQHHRRRTFQEEFIAFLEKHGMEYDPEHLWD